MMRSRTVTIRDSEDGDRYIVSFSYDRKLVEKAKQVDTHWWSQTRKQWEYLRNEDVYHQLRKVFEEHIIKQWSNFTCPDPPHLLSSHELDASEYVEAEELPEQPDAAPEMTQAGGGCDSDIATAGSGPYPEDYFDDLLEEQEITSHQLGESGTEVVVLGRHGWDTASFDAHIQSRSGKELRVYSQEMFLAYIATGEDPYDDSDILQAFASGHPAFKFLSDWGFEWPKTTIVPGHGVMGDDGDPADWPKQGVLSCMGYKVGDQGLSDGERRQILHDAFTGTIPNVDSVEHMSQWGEANTSGRLQKLARTIASLSKNAKRKQQHSMEEAIRNWDEDLEWLKSTFYRGRFRFSWPRATVY